MKISFTARRAVKKLLFILSIASLVFLGLLSSTSLATQSKRPSIAFVSPEWAVQHARDRDLRILDVRINPFDYFSGHLPNAVHIADNTFRGPNGKLPVQYWPLEQLQSLFSKAGVSNDSQVLVYSDGRDVLGATMVAYLLERSGHTNVAVLDGGFAGYRQAQLPISQEFPQYNPGQFAVRDDSSVRVTLDRVKELIGKPGVTFIDPRPADLFSGEKKVWARNGHIPGAKNIPWPTFTAGEANFHQLKPLDEIRDILARRGVNPANEIIVSCSTGREATLQYVVLKHLLGYPNVKIYEGSWTEYSSHPDLPIETGLGT